MYWEKKPFNDLLKEANEEGGEPIPLEEESSEFFLFHSMDREILMHRDCHFGGKFSIMLDYYEKEGKGVNPEFEISRIHYLERVEEETGKNLAAEIFSAADAEEVSRVQEKYKRLRSLYEMQGEGKNKPCLIADLILSEEEEAKEEKLAIIQEGVSMTPFLIDLLRSMEFLNPLFPGYSYAPVLAAECLGEIGDERGIAPLFESVGKGNENLESAIVEALSKIGDPARVFLQKLLLSEPFSPDNFHAAMILAQSFSGEEEAAVSCFERLKREQGKGEETFLGFLILGLVGLKGEHRCEFRKWVENNRLSPALLEEVGVVSLDWQEEDKGR